MAVAVQEGNSDVVEVRLDGEVLQVLLNQEVLNFAEQSWMDLKGERDGPGASAGCSHASPSHLSLASHGGHGPGLWGMELEMGASIWSVCCPSLAAQVCPSPLRPMVGGPAQWTHVPGPRLSGQVRF